MPTPSTTPYFRLISCRTIESMRAQIRTTLEPGEDKDLVLWEPHNFPARHIGEVTETWENLLFHYTAHTISRAGWPPKKVGYVITLSPGLTPEYMDGLKAAVRRFLASRYLRNAYAVAAYRMGTDPLYARLLVHSITADLKSWRLPPLEQNDFRHLWISMCRDEGLPGPPDLEPFMPFDDDEEES